MPGLLGRTYDRFHEYQPAKTLAEVLAMAKSVRGMDGIEIVYPQNFRPDPKQTVSMIKDMGLEVSAVNLNVKGDKYWQTGSFTSPDPKLRAQAVAEMKITMDLAAELSAGMITCCPLIDGHNYNFEGDYLKQWPWLEEGIGEAARYRSDVKVSLEYKPSEARNYVILGDMGRTLWLCERLGMKHIGVTMDVGHALAAKETPAEAMCLAGLANRLFYIHFNDNARDWDWDMLPASVNLWDTLEMIYYMDRMDWSGWLSYDVMTRDGDTVEAIETTISIVNDAQALLAKIGRKKLDDFVAEGIPGRTFRHLVHSLL
jgi:xylose isomerase